MLSEFLDGAPAAVVVEDGAIAFDLAESKYSLSGEYQRVAWHQSRGEFVQFGYFPGQEISQRASAHAGCARSARASHDGRDSAVSFTGDRLGSAGDRRALAGRYTGGVSEKTAAGAGPGSVELITAETQRAPRNLFLALEKLRALGFRPRYSSEASPVVRGDTRCGRPPAAPRAKSFARHPRGCGRTDRLFYRRRASPSHADLS